MCKYKVVSRLLGGIIFYAQIVYSHEVGAPFSGAIIDPLEVHHAHIEDEQRLNFFFLNGFREEEGEKRTAFISSLELAVAWTDDFRIGSEFFIPLSNAGFDEGNYGIGDIVLWPVKYALINQPETILTGVFNLELPTGSESKGLGEGNTAMGILLLFDHAYRNWYFGANGEIATNVSGETETELELAGAISYSFITGTKGGIAPTKPNQLIVPALSMEVISEFIIDGEEEGEKIITLLPGVNLWHPNSGWAFRIGIMIPVSADKESDFAVLWQIGNHLNWLSLLK